ncbi:MAG: hypothetical protein QM723_07265 [Myxococcaceae bacterium]
MSRIKDDLSPKPLPPKPVQPAAKPAPVAKKTAPKGFGSDDLSSGQGGALRRAAVAQLGAQGLSANTGAAPTGLPAFKASMLGSVGSTAKLFGPSQATPVTPTTPAQTQPTVDPAQQAKDDVAALQKAKTYLTSSDVAGLIASHPNDPVYAGNVVAAVQNSSDGAVMAAFNDGNATPEERQVIAAGISDAQNQGLLPKDFAQQVGGAFPATGDAMAASLQQVAGKEAQAIAQGAASPKVQTDAVDALTQVVDQKKQGVAEAEQELGRLMSKLGPLSADQKAAFVKQFEAEHPEFAAYQASEANLASYIGANQPALTAAAKSDPDSAKVLASAYKDLVGSPEEAQLGLTDPAARRLVAQGLTDKDVVSALSAADPDFANVTAPAAADALFEQIGTGEAPDGAFEQLHELVEAYGESGVPGLADSAKALADSIPKLQEALTKLKSAPITRESLGEFEKEWQDISGEAGETSPLGKVFAGAGFALGVLEVGEGVSKNDQAEVLKGLGDTVTSSEAIGYGAQMVARWLPEAMRDGASKFAEGLTGALEDVSGVAGALLGAIGVMQDLGHLDKGSDVAKLVGDSLTTLGGALLLVPGLEEFGVVAGIAGTVTNFVSGLMAQGEQHDLDNKYDAEASQILSGLYALPSTDPAHVDPKLGAMLMSLDPDVTQRLTKDLGLGSADWLHLANSDPDAVQALVQQLDQAEGNGSLQAITATGITGTRLLDMLQANPSMSVMLSDGRYGAGIAALQQALNLTPDQLAQTLVRMSQAGGDGDAFREVLNDITLEGGGENNQAMLQFFRDQAQNGGLGSEYQAVVKAMLGL